MYSSTSEVYNYSSHQLSIPLSFSVLRTLFIQRTFSELCHRKPFLHLIYIKNHHRLSIIPHTIITTHTHSTQFQCNNKHHITFLLHKIYSVWIYSISKWSSPTETSFISSQCDIGLSVSIELCNQWIKAWWWLDPFQSSVCWLCGRYMNILCFFCFFSCQLFLFFDGFRLTQNVDWTQLYFSTIFRTARVKISFWDSVQYSSLRECWLSVVYRSSRKSRMNTVWLGFPSNYPVLKLSHHTWPQFHSNIEC